MLITWKIHCNSNQNITHVSYAAKWGCWIGLSTRDEMRNQTNARCLQLELKLPLWCILVNMSLLTEFWHLGSGRSLCYFWYKGSMYVGQGYEQAVRAQAVLGGERGKMDLCCGIRAWNKEADIQDLVVCQDGLGWAKPKHVKVTSLHNIIAGILGREMSPTKKPRASVPLTAAKVI